jgi:hypothetical protein
VPPLAATVTVPPVAHVAKVVVGAPILRGVGSVIVTLCVATQLALSVTLMLYVPALSPDVTYGLTPTVGTVIFNASFTTNVYGVVPLVIVKLNEPLVPPLHDTFVGNNPTVIIGNCVLDTLTAFVAEQPWLSVTVNV